MLYLIAFVGGVLTILSPCILPILPFVFVRADRPFLRSGLPLLVGMALTFVVIGSLATVAGAWIVRASEFGRILALVLFAAFGVTLLLPTLAARLTQPLVRLGGRLERGSDTSIGGSVVLGVSTGLLWTPCAGPILGLILTAAAAEGATAKGALLLLAFAAGSAAALALALLAGRRVFALLKRGLGAEEWIRRGLGAAVLLGVVGIALGWDTGILTHVADGLGVSTTGVEERLVERVRPESKPAPPHIATAEAEPALTAEGTMPSLAGAVAWLNGPPQTSQSLIGKVVLIDFWTYSCINCLRSIPYVEAWAEKYGPKGLVVIGVHSPEFAFERDVKNVDAAVRALHITYPVAVDSNRVIWNAFNNDYWPAHYFIDVNGVIRAHHFGEGNYDESERIIQRLLAERDGALGAEDLVHVAGAGALATADFADVQSPETYVGYGRGERDVSPESLTKDRPARYSVPSTLQLNQWGLDGLWTVHREEASASTVPASVTFRFHARDLHLVLGPADNGRPVSFVVLLDGAVPGADAGADIDANGRGIVTGNRLYQLIRQKTAVRDRTFQIQFLDPGVEVFAFTFG